MSSIYWLARTGVVLTGWTPRAVRYALGSTISSASYLGWRSKRLVTQQNMSKVLDLPVSDPCVKRTAFASWNKYGPCASDLLHFPYMDLDRIEANLQERTQGAASWQEYVRQALDAGKGALVSSAHFGSWDIAGALAARHFPFFTVVETFHDPRLNALIQGHRRDKNIGILPMEQAARRMLTELKNNHVVAVAVDRPLTKEKGIEVTFFGHKTYVPGGPAALALKAGSAIVPGFVWYGRPGQFFIRTFPPLFPLPYEGAEGRTREIARLTQYMYAAQEEVVRENPTQWFMFRRFWPEEEETTREESRQHAAVLRPQRG